MLLPSYEFCRFYELISFDVVFMNYWAGLHDEADDEDLWSGASNLLLLATMADGSGSRDTATRNPSSSSHLLGSGPGDVDTVISVPKWETL
jgi:hypothetical protein